MILPYVKNGTFEDGDWIKLPQVCLSCKKCLNTLEKDIFPFQCSKGLSVYKEIDGGRVYPGLFIQGFYDKNFAKRFSDKIVLTSIQLKELLEYEKKTHSTKFYEDLFHETRQLNSQISSLSERISKLEGENDSQAANLGLSIFQISSLISKRFLELDLCTNDQILNFKKKTKVGIYKKFDKMKIIHANCVRKPRIEFIGNLTDEIYAVDMFDLLPFLLFDNAKKYTHKDGCIFVRFSNNRNGEPVVTIENLSEYISEEELHWLTSRDFRGSNSSSQPGSGLGMWLVKKLCDFHNIEISNTIGLSDNFSIGSYKYLFKTELCFKEFVEPTI